MGIDEEIYVMREKRPITYFEFRHSTIYMFLEDDEDENNIKYEKAELMKTDSIGYWISGKDFLKILDNLEKYNDHKQIIDNLRNYFKENPVLPSDQVLYKIIP